MGFESLASELESRKKKHLYRKRRLLQSPQGTEVQLDNKHFLAFCNNDYLGLANHPDVVRAFQQATNECGVGGGASHLVNGHHQQHHLLEEELAEFTGRDRVLLFSNGYMANIGAVNALLSKGDLVLEDRLNHASLLDAGLLSGARFQRYQHANLESLSQYLSKPRAEDNRTLVVTDGVFSMDGDIPPLPDLANTCRENNAWLMVDDAHGFGTLGQNGGGCVEHFGLGQDDVQVLVGTLGKAFGTAGAFVAGSELLIETLIQNARTYIYTTSMPPAIAAATRVSLKRLQSEHWRRERLAELIKRFRTGAAQLGYELMDSASPIQPILIGSEEKALALAAWLEEHGVLITAIRPPTVPKGTARLRITICAEHTAQQVDRLLGLLDQARVQ
ncbi:8-amino-7-oxononanoate synthase [Alkalimarinus alittae]|uniref:8-amino-7-oxononanoate synthase n=1 Tax=Alkalimarinus alittae TaxID=2961619 RepID=A0ABY6N4P2_9ALTE|nr:8-amino-7-oxononanoate synthase [Alkalimarinus alittae]UZE97088.1 8-amino-7-oxononanoate synthase [Alkalimarinus alittae]